MESTSLYYRECRFFLRCCPRVHGRNHIGGIRDPSILHIGKYPVGISIKSCHFSCCMGMVAVSCVTVVCVRLCRRCQIVCGSIVRVDAKDSRSQTDVQETHAPCRRPCSLTRAKLAGPYMTMPSRRLGAGTVRTGSIHSQIGRKYVCLDQSWNLIGVRL